MNTRKAMQRAARKSLEGRYQFVVKVGRTCHVVELRDLRNLRGRIECAYNAGRYVAAA